MPPYRRSCGDVVSTRAAFDTRRVVGTGAVELGEWDLLAFPEGDHPKHSAGFTEATAKHPQRKYMECFLWDQGLLRSTGLKHITAAKHGEGLGGRL